MSRLNLLVVHSIDPTQNIIVLKNIRKINAETIDDLVSLRTPVDNWRDGTNGLQYSCNKNFYIFDLM